MCPYLYVKELPKKMETQIYSPRGVGEIVPLDRKQHRFAFPKVVDASRFRQQIAIPLALVEFNKAACHYPIVFIRGKKEEFQTVLIAGLQEDQNVFVDTQGSWREGYYVPAYVRAYPLCIAEVIEPDGSSRKDRLVCMAKDAIATDGVELFNEDGEATEFWQEKERFLKEFEDARTWTQDMCRLLKEHDVLVPFNIQADLPNGKKHVISGMYRVDEAKLGKLSSYQMRQMINRGWMQGIYAHINSLHHFQDLLVNTSQ